MNRDEALEEIGWLFVIIVALGMIILLLPAIIIRRIVNWMMK